MSLADALAQVASEEAATAFVDYRKGMGKRYALTPRAAQMIARSLQTIRDQGGDPDEALDMAQERGWMTIKPGWYWNAKKSEGRNLRVVSNGQHRQDDRLAAFVSGARGTS